MIGFIDIEPANTGFNDHVISMLTNCYLNADVFENSARKLQNFKFFVEIFEISSVVWTRRTLPLKTSKIGNRLILNYSEFFEWFWIFIIGLLNLMTHNNES